VTLSRMAEMRYEGQFHEVEVSLPSGNCTPKKIKAAVAAFHQRHEQLHLFSMLQQDVEFLNFHLRLSSPQTGVKLPVTGLGPDDPKAALKLRRPCWFKGKWVDTPVYVGKLLRAGNRLSGPAIIEEPNTTVVIPDGFRCTANQCGYYVLTRRSNK